MSKLFYFDLETTCTKFWRNGIHQISGEIEIDGETKTQFNFKVKPNPACDIEDDALKIAGITREDLAGYDEMHSTYKVIESLLGKYVDKFDKNDKFHLVGFNNAAFDNAFFRAFFVQNAPDKRSAEYGNYFGSWFWSDTIDVMVLASNKLKNERSKLENFKLSTVAKYLGIEVDESKLHDAYYDIYLTKEIYKIVCN